MIYTFAQLPPREISTDELPPRTIALNITQSVNNQAPDALLTQANIMAFVQRAWRLNPDKAKAADLILATYVMPDKRRLILGAFRFGRQDTSRGGDHFVVSRYSEDDKRCIFLAEPADSTLWNKYVGHYLPKTQPGEANPVRYYDFD